MRLSLLWHRHPIQIWLIYYSYHSSSTIESTTQITYKKPGTVLIYVLPQDLEPVRLRRLMWYMGQILQGSENHYNRTHCDTHRLVRYLRTNWSEIGHKRSYKCGYITKILWKWYTWHIKLKLNHCIVDKSTYIMIKFWYRKKTDHVRCIIEIMFNLGFHQYASKHYGSFFFFFFLLDFCVDFHADSRGRRHNWLK